MRVSIKSNERRLFYQLRNHVEEFDNWNFCTSDRNDVSKMKKKGFVSEGTVGIPVPVSDGQVIVGQTYRAITIGI